MSDILNAAEVRSGTWGELWLDGEQVAECYGCQIKVNKTKDDVTRCRTLVAGKKMTAVSITGTIRIYNATSRLIKLEAEALKQGKDLRHTIISNLDDPDNADNQRIAVKGVSFDDLTLADWQAAQLGQIGKHLPFAFAQRFRPPVQFERPAFELLHPGGVIFVELLDGRQRRRRIAVAHRTVDLQQIGFRVDHLACGFLLLLFEPDSGEFLLQRLLPGRAFETVRMVEEPVDGRHGESPLGGDLHALVVEVGREPREYERRVAGRQVDLLGARHLRPVDEEGDLFDGGLHLRLPRCRSDGRRADAQQQPCDAIQTCHNMVRLGWFQTNSSSTRSIFCRISAVQRLPMLPSWVWCTSRVGVYAPFCTAMPTSL